MSVFTIILRIILSATFISAGATKIITRKHFASALPNMGVPASLVSAVAFVIPPCEVVIGVLLLVNATAFFAALAALFMLIAFSALLVFTITRGQGGGCNCFGSLSSDKPVGPQALVRNGLLAAMAAMIVAAGPI